MILEQFVPKPNCTAAEINSSSADEINVTAKFTQKSFLQAQSERNPIAAIEVAVGRGQLRSAWLDRTVCAGWHRAIVELCATMNVIQSEVVHCDRGRSPPTTASLSAKAGRTVLAASSDDGSARRSCASHWSQCADSNWSFFGISRALPLELFDARPAVV